MAVYAYDIQSRNSPSVQMLY